MSTSTTASLRTVSLARLREVIRGALMNRGLRRDAADCIASVVSDAERDGYLSHGLFRVPGFLHALETGAVKAEAEPTVLESTRESGVVVVDAHEGFAAPAFAAGRPELERRAKANGIACLVLRRTRHFSALWWEVEQLASSPSMSEEGKASDGGGLLSLAFVNSAAFVAHSPGGTTPVYGTNPLAFGCPRGRGRLPIVFDQASATMARGEIQLALQQNEPLRPGVAIYDGVETLLPKEALSATRGAQLPFGGHKGTNIALMVELLAGVATNSPIAVEAAAELHRYEAAEDASSPPSSSSVSSPLPLGGCPTVNGELIIALDPTALFGSSNQDFTDRVEALLCAVLGTSPSEIRLPADRRYENRRRAHRRGGKVDVDASLFTDIERKADGAHDANRRPEK